MKQLIALLVGVIIGMSGIYAQATITSIASSSKMSILGTSTLHDWESVVEDFAVTAKYSEKSITDVQFTAKVKSIKSGKGGMDKNTYKAMDADKYPEIKFTASDLMIDGTSLKGSGNLTIKGATKSIPVELNYETWSEDSYLVTGAVTFNMSEYGVEPPTAMMGAIKTGDEVTIDFEINLSEN